jgi:hypothetical protein
MAKALAPIKVEKKHVAIAVVVATVLAGMYFVKEVKPNLTEPQQHAVEGMVIGAVLAFGVIQNLHTFKKDFGKIGIEEVEV